jgi:hypothetical protein
MAKRRTQVQVTKILNTGEEVIILNKNKMNSEMCKKVVSKLLKDWKTNANNTTDIKDMHFKCIER